MNSDNSVTLAMLDQVKAMMPWVVMASGMLVTLLVSLIRIESKTPAQLSALGTLLATLIFSVKGLEQTPVLVLSGAFEVSFHTLWNLAIISVLGMLWILAGSRYLSREKIHFSDYYHLLLMVLFGASIFPAAKDLLGVFIALELMSLPVFTLAGFRRNDSRSNESALKYFVLSGAMAALFLLGASFMYGATGYLQIQKIVESVPHLSAEAQALFSLGVFLLLVSFLFKLAAAPFHFWKPDVYEGAPTLVTGVMATVVTLSASVTLAFWAKPFLGILGPYLKLTGFLSLILGSAILIQQVNLKRLTAYSSITNAGFILLAIASMNSVMESEVALRVFLVTYSLGTIGFITALLQAQRPNDFGHELLDLTGLFKKNPELSFLITVFSFSQVGMPLTAGFIGKFSILKSGMSAGHLAWVMLASVAAVIASYAYLRPVAMMFMRDPDPTSSEFQIAPAARFVMWLTAIALIYFGIFPGSLIHWIQGVVVHP